MRASRYESINCNGTESWQLVLNPYGDRSFTNGIAPLTKART